MRKLIATLALIAAITVGAASPSDATPLPHRHRAPNAQEFQELGEAVYSDPRGNCHLEWDGRWVTGKHGAGHWVDAWFEAICAR